MRHSPSASGVAWKIPRYEDKAMKKLHIEEPYKPELIHVWDEGTRAQFALDADDRELLESGETLFRGDTAFSLEEE